MVSSHSTVNATTFARSTSEARVAAATRGVRARGPSAAQGGLRAAQERIPGDAGGLQAPVRAEHRRPGGLPRAWPDARPCGPPPRPDRPWWSSIDGGRAPDSAASSPSVVVLVRLGRWGSLLPDLLAGLGDEVPGPQAQILGACLDPALAA